MKPLDYLNLAYIWCSTYPALRRQWQPSGEGAEMRVAYGYDRVPGPQEHVFGGLVKLQDLNRKFPQCLERPNLLYLVSSALPYFPVRMAKMAHRSGAKIVINQNGVAYPGWYGKGWEKLNVPMQELHELADYVFYQSKFCRVSAEKFLGTSHRASEILYNPVDTDVFRPPDAKAPVSDGITLLLAGSHWSLYRPRVALEVLKLVCRQDDRVQLDIAGRFCWGKSPEAAEGEVREIARSLGVEERVRFSGPYSQQEAVHLFQRSSILLHTKYNDPCPRLVVEAMACGLPVVYSATGGTPELVGDEAGLGVDGPLDWGQDHPPDPEPLAAGVLQVIDSLAAYRQGARARAVARFDTKPWLQRHGEIFRQLLESV